MATPVIDSASPDVGHTSGWALVSIVGSNFRTPTADTSTVRVSFGGVAALRVSVASDTLIRALTPANNPGLASILVENMDDSGVPIPGESATLANAFRYARPKITHGTESTLVKALRAIMHKLRQQVIGEVVHTVHVDYDEDTGAEIHMTKVAKVPAIVVVGPDVTENRFYSLNEGIEVDEGTPEGDFVETREPLTVDIGYEIIGLSDRSHEALNLLEATLLFFKKNKMLEIDGLSYELDLVRGSEPSMRSAANNDNLRSFSGRFVIRGVDLVALGGIPSGETIGVPNHEIVGRGRTLEDEVDIGSAEQLESGSPIVRSIKSEG